jgi:cysteine desulfuration protein SufE
MYYRADGDAIISKGLLYLLLQVVNGLTPDEIVNADFYFIKEIGLSQHLSPSRANGLNSMIQRIKDLAAKYKN